ncbi:MAG: restriction endonuclease subunit S [Cyanobacteria bacterium P01_E01_bin.42]
MRYKSVFPIVKLNEISEKIDYGLTASARDIEENPKFLRITDIQNNSVNWDNVPSCECTEKDFKKYALKQGDIVFARTGATTGKSFLIRHCPSRSVFASYLIRVRPSPKIDSEYLSRFFQTPNYWNQITLSSTGTAQTGVNSTKLKDLKIPLPPLEEQKRIAAILDKADRIRRKRQEAIRLTEELARSLFLDMFGDPVTNPKGWDVLEVGKIVNSIESGWSPKCDSRTAEKEEWGILKLGAITWGIFDEMQNKALLPDTKPRLDLEIKIGDLLFSRKNTYELVGASAFVYKTRSKLLLPDLIFRLNVNGQIDPVYLWQALSQSSLRKEISRLASGSAGSMPNISKAKLRTLKVTVPPLDRQKKYNQILQKCWKQQESLEEAAQESENLFNSLLQRAFRGEL